MKRFIMLASKKIIISQVAKHGSKITNTIPLTTLPQCRAESLSLAKSQPKSGEG